MPAEILNSATKGFGSVYIGSLMKAAPGMNPTVEFSESRENGLA